MRTILYVVATPDGLDLRVGEEADLPNMGAVLITFDVPVSRLIDGIPELRERISTLTRERDEARAEVEKLCAVVQDLCEVLDECVYEIDTRYGPPGSNRIDRELIERARAAMAKAKIDPLHIAKRDEARTEVKRLRAALTGAGDDKHERVEK